MWGHYSSDEKEKTAKKINLRLRTKELKSPKHDDQAAKPYMKSLGLCSAAVRALPKIVRPIY